MPPPGGEVLFDGRPVADLRATVRSDIKRRAAALDPDSRSSIPEALFHFAVFREYDFSLPTLQFDRVYARNVEIDGTRYLELHVPMVGEPRNLSLSPDAPALAEFYRAAFEYEIVDGDLCLYVELDRTAPEDIDVFTDEVLSRLENRYEQVRDELDRLEHDARAMATAHYRRQTGQHAWRRSVPDH